MSKKMKVLISMLVVVLLVTVIPATVVMAQEDETAPAPPTAGNDGLLARVAEILGISPDELAGAFNQARQGVREECQATDNCNICQENANRFRERWTEKKQEMGKRFQGNRTESQKNRRFRISQSVRGRQMIAVPEGWRGPLPPSAG
ncbi:hypothetical protein ES703_107587 [subsurface metagenome]